MPGNAAVQQCTIPGHVGSYRHPRSVLAVTGGDYSHTALEGSAVPRAFQRDGLHEEHTVIRTGHAVPVSGVRFIPRWVRGDLVRAERGRRSGTGCQRHQPALPGVRCGLIEPELIGSNHSGDRSGGFRVGREEHSSAG
jgi:hypothetical protein